jgi:AcrR family transcriptional regulator
VENTEAAACKRPYELGKRLEASDRSKMAVLQAARVQLEASGFQNLTMEALARQSGVSRQTVHNLFGTKAAVLEALFDQIARDGGMERMRNVMRQSDTESMLEEFVKVFAEFWANNRVFFRRIHGIAAIDPEFGAVVQMRNGRRKMAAARVVERLGGELAEETKIQRSAVLYAMTSFEFFDALFDGPVETEKAYQWILLLVKKAVFDFAARGKP